MDSITVQTASRESSPTSTPQTSTSGASRESPSPTKRITESPATSPDRPSKIVTLKIPRLAAQHAQAARKRGVEDPEARDAPAKRARVTTRSMASAANDTGYSRRDSSSDTPGSSQSTTLSSDVSRESTQLSQSTALSSDVPNERMQTLIEIAPQPSASNTPVQRSPPAGKPLVWANGRGALCEALPYFRSYKSSLHTAKIVAQGFLIDSEVEARDYFGSQVLISSVGGGRERDAETGAMVRTKDATESATNYKAFLNAKLQNALVVVIAGEENPLYPCQPPHCYAVLGYFHVTDIWRERQAAGKGVTIWRIRLEKADLAEPSWWMPEGEDGTTSSLQNGVRAPVATCNNCGVESKEIFTAGWLCLNYRCKDYFTLPDGPAFDPGDLTYTDAFLGERTPFVGEVPSVKPPVPDTTGHHGTELALRYGFVCPDCGCCNRRVYWNRWVCENEECQYTRDTPMVPYPVDLLEKESSKFDKAMEKRRIKFGVNENTLCQKNYPVDPFATVYHRGYLPHSQTLTLGGYLVRQYFLPDSDGKILGSFSIFSAKLEVFCRPDGPTDLFRTLELTDIGLRRNPAAVIGHKLEGYTRHFQQNFGARYKFGVSVQSKGFADAPDVILRALQRLIWAKKVAVQSSNEFIQALNDGTGVSPGALVADSGDFNELLALGYMEDDKINYHDDGESELGPVVAALSLGSPSTMSFRPKRKTGFIFPTNKTRGKEAYKEVLEVTMKHGDMMVMAGPGIQRVYEHTVNPHGMRRFSLTARYIDPDRMTSQEDRDDAAVKGAIPKHAEAFVYDGH